MSVIGQKNCGCTCRNLTEWGPIGPGLPDATCPLCSGAGAYDVGTGTGSPPYDGGAPCEFIAIFDCPESFTRDGLYFANASGRVLAMLAERLVEENCTWTARKQATGTGTGSFSGCNSLLGWIEAIGLSQFTPARQFAGGFKRECHHGTNWPQYFPGVAQPGYVAGGVPEQNDLVYKTPRFGCEYPADGSVVPSEMANGTWAAPAPAADGTYFNNTSYTNSVEGVCGWFDLLNQIAQIYIGGTRVLSTPYVECLYSATRIEWEFSLTAKTLVGTTDYGEEIIYSAVVATCGSRVALSLTSGQAWAPPRVCVVPGYTRFITPCTDKEHVVACCDSGVMITNYSSEFPGCNIPLTFFEARRYRDLDSTPASDEAKAAQGSISSSCGVFYGTWTYNCTTKPPPLTCIGEPVSDDTWGSREYTFEQLTWCEAGAWKASIFCRGWSLVEGNTIIQQIFTTICTNVATTLIQCHPVFGHTWTCDIPGTYTLPFVPYPSGTGTGTGTGYYDCVTRHPCCCSAATVDVPCCPSQPINQSLFLDLVADCAALNGGSATLTYQGTSSSLPGSIGSSRHYWTGSFSGGACGTVYVLWHLPATSGCDSVLQLGLSSDFSNDCGFQVNDQISCPFTSKTYASTAWNSGVCPCCSGNVTATVAA